MSSTGRASHLFSQLRLALLDRREDRMRRITQRLCVPIPTTHEIWDEIISINT
jgi:hypothetical protein